jgi:hypothetical protein
LAAEVAPRIAPLLLLLRDAALIDSESVALLADANRSRLERMSDNASFLAERSYLRAGVTVEEARDILWLYTSPEVFDLLVNQRGWTPDRFGKHVAEGIVQPSPDRDLARWPSAGTLFDGRLGLWRRPSKQALQNALVSSLALGFKYLQLGRAFLAFIGRSLARLLAGVEQDAQRRRAGGRIALVAPIALAVAF